MVLMPGYASNLLLVDEPLRQAKEAVRCGTKMDNKTKPYHITHPPPPPPPRCQVTREI